MGQTVLLIVLILINAFFASCEIAFISLNDMKIELQAKKGDKKSKRIYKMIKNPSEFLSTIQIGITLAGFLSSAYAADTYASKLSPLLNNTFPFFSLQIWNNISIVIITIILSYFTLIFGELVPKRIAMKHYEKIAFSSIGIISAVATIMRPFVKFLTWSTNVVSKIFGVSEEQEEVVTEEEIRMMTDVGEQKGTIDKIEDKMIDNVFEFDDKEAFSVMVPRNEIYALDYNLTINQFITEISNNITYSRIPVYDETIDQIKGIVYVKDIIVSELNKNTRVKNLMKDVFFVSETKPINEIFEELRKRKIQMAIVLDEFGGTSGLITMEDIIEEIVGEIYDEYDVVEKKYERVNNKTYRFKGSIHLYEVEKILDTEIEQGEYDTLSGFIIDKLGRIPEDGEKCTLETEKMYYKVEKVKNNIIEKVKVIKK